ncbi:MAG: maleylacetate reductase [Rhodococcus sp. (in: high G+C Gram-positive bacteria)]|uniref:maleylacetate reductase n=1 Tax=Rhodococcus sp. TaxID=1831 RepID=UPI003BB04FC8
MRSFVYNTLPSRVIFGSGTVAAVRDEVERLRRSRILLVAGPRLGDVAAMITDQLGEMVVARFTGAAMHTPTDVTARALAVAEAAAVDCVVAVGGGSATGLSKALAVRAGYDQVILPTTYAGSEVTPVLGETADGVKTTQSSPDVLPETVIYDVDLTLGMPRPLTLTSAVNAMAHAVEALYSQQANPVTDGMALESIAGINRALPFVMAKPGDVDARAELLQSAWLAGQCLASVGMGLHHKLCHILGGTFGLPHAATHTVVLPYAMAYNAAAVPAVMDRIADVMGVTDAAAGVFELVAGLGGPTSLGALGFTREDVPPAARAAAATPYPNPREVTAEGIEELLVGAVEGRRPVSRAG